jgi:hypothetical protein
MWETRAREISEHERISKVPKWLMGILFPGKRAQGFSFTKQSRIVIALVLVLAEVSEAALYTLSRSLSLLIIMLGSLAFFGSLLVIISVFPICIRKDCFDCTLGFHVVAHERTHLRLSSLDEEQVETETLKETRNRPMPLLLSNQRICKGCRFRWYRMFSEATSEYLKEKKAD